MDPIDLHQVMFLEKLQQLEWAGRGQNKNYSYTTGFETRRKNQDFGRQNISMRPLPLDLTPFGTNTTNILTSPIDYIPVEKKRQTPRQKHDQRNRQHD